MHINVTQDRDTKQGLLGSKTRYSVTIHLELDQDESEVIRDYGVYRPNLNDYLNYDFGDDLYKKLEKAGTSVMSYVSPVTIEFDSIQQAGKFEDGVLSAFEAFKNQILATQSRVRALGQTRKISY